MGLKKLRPLTPGQRFATVPTFDEITKTTPERSLLEPLRKKGGRNAQGRVTVRHRGGGHKRNYRLVDFRRDKLNVPAKVAAIEYDPNRSARLALLHTRTERSATFSRPRDWPSATRSCPDRRWKSARGTRQPSATSRWAR